MDFDTFYKKYDRYMRYEARLCAKKYYLPEEMREDLTQAGYVQVIKYLACWKEEFGANPMSYLKKSIWSAMCQCARTYYHHKKRGGLNIVRYVFQLDEEIGYNHASDPQDSYVSPEVKLDLDRSIQKLLKSNHRATSRFLYSTFNKHGGAGADIADDDGVTRQAVSWSVLRTRKHLKKLLSKNY